MYVSNNAIVVHPFSSLSVFVAMNAHSALGLADTKHILGSENGELIDKPWFFFGHYFRTPPFSDWKCREDSDIFHGMDKNIHLESQVGPVV